MGCLCGNSTRDKFSLDCDSCHVWFHGACVGVRKDACPEIWLCHGCLVGNVVQEVTKTLQSKCYMSKTKKSKKLVDEKWIYRQLWFDNCFDELTTNQLGSSRNVHLAIWIQELLDEVDDENSEKDNMHTSLAKHFLQKWRDDISKIVVNKALANDNHIPVEHQVRITFKVAVNYSDLYCSIYRSSLGVLVKCMCNERSIALKKFAIKVRPV